MHFLIIHSLLSIANSEPWFCGGDISQEEEIPEHRRRLQTRSSVFSPIRIFYYYYNFDLGDPVLNDYFYSTLLPATDSFFKRSLSVYSIEGNLVLSSTNCLSSVPIPIEHKTIGVPNTDLIIYITSNNLTGVSYVAQAGVCERQSGGLRNVLAGTMIINIPNFIDSGFTSRLTTLTHEITHILGFSSSSFSYFRNSDGVAYPTDTLKKVVNLRGVDRNLIVSPTVVAKAREAFNCATLEGIELEEYGSSGAHWDKRIMMNDYMTSFIPAEPYWSTITLALLQDSGWYNVDYSLCLAPVFGRTSGCNFFTEPCLINGVSQDPRIWCDTQASWTCDILSLSKGTCKVTTYTTALPTWFQYFSVNTTGGSDSYSDYCPYRLRYSNGACRGNSVTTFTLSKSDEVISLKSRCFVSNLVISGYSQPPPYSACYEVIACSATSATVKIGTQTLDCPFTGGVFTVPGYSGSITCPASDLLCADVPCKNLCYGRGICTKGICNCFDGFGDESCSVVCSENCLKCSSSACFECLSPYFLFSGACILCPANCNECSSTTVCSRCENGFFLDSDFLCSACDPRCLTCTGFNQCGTCITGYVVFNGICVFVCPVNCVTCSDSQCIQCDVGFYLASPVECRSCSAFCDECSSETNCLTCTYGYTLVGGTCLLICSNNCLTCTSYWNCLSCSSGYYLSSGACYQCKIECLTCSSSTICLTCATDYVLIGNDCVIQCPNNCITCSSSSNCLTCISGFYLSSGACFACASTCLSCTSLNGCTECITGYYLSSGTCYVCSSICTSCTSLTVCQGCISGYTLSLSGVCNPICSSMCTTCTSPTVCTLCSAGSYLSNGACLACMTGCTSCTGSSTCSKCSVGYYLKTSKCFACASTCSACTSSGCTACKPGYTLSRGTCK